MAVTEIDGINVEPKLGMFVKPEFWNIGSNLEIEPWAQAPWKFRLATNSGGPIKSVAVSIYVTGRTFQYPFGYSSRWVKVKVEFHRDDEPSDFSGGWMCIK